MFGEIKLTSQENATAYPIWKMEWFKLAIQLRGSVAPIILPRVLCFAGLGAIVSLLYDLDFPVYLPFLATIITNVVFNLVLGLLLVFRTNTAYERYWEGRKLWGGIVVNTRNLSRQIWINIRGFDPKSKAEKEVSLKLLNAFALTTKLTLRREDLNSEIEALLTPEQYQELQATKTPPLKLIAWIGNYLQIQYQKENLDRYQFAALNQLLDNLVEAFTGCDRISKTPIPLSYAIYLKRVTLLYCIALPFQCVATVGWWTGLIVGLISFVLLGIEQIGNEIEDPFGLDPNDLPLDTICQTIQANLEDLMKTSLVEDFSVPVI